MTRPASPEMPFTQIGAEGGFLPAPVALEQLLIAPAERADVIVDFTGLPIGAEIFLINEGPDEPFGGGEPGEAFEAADPNTTGQVMRFTIVARTGPDTSLPSDELTLPRIKPSAGAVRTRKLSLNEEDSATLPGVGPRAAVLGTLDAAGNPVPLPLVVKWTVPA